MPVPLLFDISGGEFLVVILFVLLFFGAKGIPDIARGMGRFMRQVRDASNEVQREINRGASDVRRAALEHQRQFSGIVDEASPEHPTEPPAPAPKPQEPA
ncbi:MAG TPA: twin-arginine translocase TatA/TatE family subunit [Flavobacteriales bacterium]|nr:twin-arginine translocase TatA/TatE family subunit [Flavobacteriales bacterium]